MILYKKVIEYEKVDDKVKGALTCKQCYSNDSVQWQCENCTIELCSSCHVNHTNIPILKNHKVVKLDTNKATENVIPE